MMPRQPVISLIAEALKDENAVPIPTEKFWEMRGQPSLCANCPFSLTGRGNFV
jgi:hypothetical protein